MEDLIYKLAENEPETSGAYEVWRQVFVAEQGIPEELVFSGEDAAGKLSMVVKDGERVIGTARVMLLAGDRAKIERMAVLKAFRSQGAGRGIIDFLHNELKSRGVKYVFLHAQHGVTGFYKACGFRETGEPFSEAGIRHVKMETEYL